MIFVFDTVEIIAGKRRKCWLPTFSPFPTFFSNSFLLRVVKSRDCVVQLNALLPKHDVLINAREDVGFQNKTSEKDSCKHNSDPGSTVLSTRKYPQDISKITEFAVDKLIVYEIKYGLNRAGFLESKPFVKVRNC